MLDNIITEATPNPLRTVIYGSEKIGKSRFCSQFPKPLFLDIEGGLNFIKTNKTPLIKSSKEVIDYISSLINDEHDYKTLVIDSADWLENIIGAEFAKKYNAESIGDQNCKQLSYGQGYKLCADRLRLILKGLDALLEKRGVQPVFIAHTKIRPVDNPVDSKYDKFELKLSNACSSILKEWADVIMFAHKKFYTDSEGKATNWEPVLLAGNNPAFEGGGRIKLPDEIPLDYKSFEKAVNQSISNKPTKEKDNV